MIIVELWQLVPETRGRMMRILKIPRFTATEFAVGFSMSYVKARLVTVHELDLVNGAARRFVYRAAARKGYGQFDGLGAVKDFLPLRPEHGPVHIPVGMGEHQGKVFFGFLISFPDGRMECGHDIGKWDDVLRPETRLLLAVRESRSMPHA